MTDDRLSTLYRKYGPIINARCRQMLDDVAAAEDATQETFLRVHRHLDRVPAEREALYWIYRVTTNLCLNELRDRRRRPVPVEHVDGDADGGLRALASLERRALARTLVDAAPPKLRVVAWLCHLDGLGQEEIAAITRLSKRTVATRLARFTESARRFLRREGS